LRGGSFARALRSRPVTPRHRPELAARRNDRNVAAQRARRRGPGQRPGPRGAQRTFAVRQNAWPITGDAVSGALRWPPPKIGRVQAAPVGQSSGLGVRSCSNSRTFLSHVVFVEGLSRNFYLVRSTEIDSYPRRATIYQDLIEFSPTGRHSANNKNL